MNLDERLHQSRSWLDTTAAATSPDLADLDRRQWRRRRHLVTIGVAFAVFVSGIGLYAVTGGDTPASTIAAGAAPQPEPPQPAPDPQPADGPAFVLPTPPERWEQTTPLTTGVDHASRLAGEDFSQVYVRFDTDQDPFSAHSGDITGTIRVAVGTYDTLLRDLFTGPATPVTIGDREFDLIETNTDDGTIQTALVPVDLSERTFVLVARGIDSDTALAMAQPIDPSRSIPRIGPAPDDFIVIYSGPAEFAALDTGTAITYRTPSGDQTFTVTTYRGIAISCFSNAWAYPNTEITQLGGDAGVVAQLDGRAGFTGTYRALWNHSHDTLIGITATGIDRDTLIDLADQLVLDQNMTGYRAHLELIV